jgi:hypothetical protein
VHAIVAQITSAKCIHKFRVNGKNNSNICDDMCCGGKGAEGASQLSCEVRF